jgi:hypothetical protein
MTMYACPLNTRPTRFVFTWAWGCRGIGFKPLSARDACAPADWGPEWLQQRSLPTFLPEPVMFQVPRDRARLMVGTGVSLCVGLSPLAPRVPAKPSQMNTLLRRAGVSVCLGAALREHVHSLYLAFAREVYRLCAASNNLQSLLSLYTMCTSLGVPLEPVHDFVRSVVRALYQPTLMSLQEAVGSGADRVNAPASWLWYPLPFYSYFQHIASKQCADLTASQPSKGSARLSVLCSRRVCVGVITHLCQCSSAWSMRGSSSSLFATCTNTSPTPHPRPCFPMNALAAPRSNLGGPSLGCL